MFKRKSAAAYGVVLAFALAAAVHAWDSSPRATLTFSEPMSLPNVTLAARTYVFELADPDSSRSIVRVRGKEDYRHVYLSAFTYRIARPAGLSVDRPVLLGESAAGAAPPILAWCPCGGATGHEFISSVVRGERGRRVATRRAAAVLAPYLQSPAATNPAQ